LKIGYNFAELQAKKVALFFRTRRGIIYNLFQCQQRRHRSTSNITEVARCW